MNIRRITLDDAAAVNEIINHYILNTTSTFYTEAFSVEQRREWIAARTPVHPAFVLERESWVVGLAGLLEFKARPAYLKTVENMVYLRDGMQGRGYGLELMRVLIGEAKRLDYHSIVATVCAEQTASIRAHEKMGFQKVGHLKQVGRKFDRWLDIIYLQLRLDENAD